MSHLADHLTPGRRPKLTAKDIVWAKKRWRLAMKVDDLATCLDVTKATLYRYAQRYEFGPHPNRDHSYQPRTVDHGPIPTLFRCEMCFGRCTEASGHPTCQVEAVA